MPSPVEFTVQTSSLPPGWEGDANDLNQAIAERLVVAPTEEWTAFVRGSQQPSSDLGPWATDGKEWRFWDAGSGTYVPQTLQGSGLVARSVTLAALALSSDTNAVLTFNASREPTTVTGSEGETLRIQPDGTVDFSTLPFFDVRISADAAYSSDGTQQILALNTVRAQAGVTFDTTNYRLPVTAGSVWHFDFSAQIENNNGGGSTGVQHIFEVRLNGITGSGIGAVHLYGTAQSRDGVGGAGIMSFLSDGYVDFAVSTTTAEAPAAKFAIAANSVNTRVSGHRIK